MNIIIRHKRWLRGAFMHAVFKKQVIAGKIYRWQSEDFWKIFSLFLNNPLKPTIWHWTACACHWAPWVWLVKVCGEHPITWTPTECRETSPAAALGYPTFQSWSLSLLLVFLQPGRCRSGGWKAVALWHEFGAKACIWVTYFSSWTSKLSGSTSGLGPKCRIRLSF